MNIKTFVPVIGLSVLMGVIPMPSAIGAEATTKSDKALDVAPGSVPATVLDAKARDAAPLEYSNGYLAQRLGAMQRSTTLTGARILDRDDMPLGKVTDILVELQTGRIYGALVSLGSPDYLITVPGKSFLPADSTKVVLDMQKDMLKSAPRMSTTDWEFAALRKSIGDSYAYFNQKPLWDETAGPGQINKGSDFIGMEVRDKDDADLGKVMNLMVDLPTARIVFAVISFDGSDKTLYAVPPAALMLTSDKKALFLDETREKIRTRARQGDYFWTEMTDRAWAANTCRSYGVEPDFDDTPAKADSTREPVRAKVDDAPVAVSKVAGKSDSEITRMVLTALVREDMSNAFNHKNIKINTLNGRVTLTGKVKNDKQKGKLAEIAESVVGPGFVNNQLEAR